MVETKKETQFTQLLEHSREVPTKKFSSLLFETTGAELVVDLPPQIRIALMKPTIVLRWWGLTMTNFDGVPTISEILPSLAAPVRQIMFLLIILGVQRSSGVDF